MNVSERVENKKAELMQIFATLPEKQLRCASDLINQAAFMAVTLEDLAATISENGTVEEYQNGANQRGRKISSEAQLYNSLIAKYTALETKLLQLIPEEKAPAKIMPKEAKAHDQAAADQLERKREKENAFFDALKYGEVKQSDYKAFCEEWERQNA